MKNKRWTFMTILVFALVFALFPATAMAQEVSEQIDVSGYHEVVESDRFKITSEGGAAWDGMDVDADWPMLIEAKYGADTSVLEKTLAAALLYTPEEETEWNRMLAEEGYEGILQRLSGLDPSSEIYARVLALAKSGKIL